MGEKTLIERLREHVRIFRQAAGFIESGSSVAILFDEAAAALSDRDARIAALEEGLREIERLKSDVTDLVNAGCRSQQADEKEIADLKARIAELQSTVVSFCGPWAVTYAREHGLPPNHLYPNHYDILESCGARMVDFTRALLTPTGTEKADPANEAD